LPVLERFLQVSKNLVIIAETSTVRPLATLVVNKLRGTLNVLAIKAPGFGDRRKAMLEDIAVLTGAGHFEEIGRKLDSTTVQDLGRARKVQSNKDETHGSSKAVVPRQAIKAAIQQIRRRLPKPPVTSIARNLQERLPSGGRCCGHQESRRHRGGAQGERSTASRTRSPQPARRLKRASCLAVDGGSSTRCQRWIAFSRSSPAISAREP